LANYAANIFGSSPLVPLERHVDIAYRCAKQLNGYFKAAINLRVDRKIFVSWVVTIPAGAILTIIFFFLFRFILP